MRQLWYNGPRHLEWRDVPEPRILHPEDAIVRPIAATTCDLDIRMIRGPSPFTRPCALGHEAIAEVVEAGPGARFFRGQIVVVSWHVSCGMCHRCAGLNKPNTCSHYPRGAAFGSPVTDEFGSLFSDLVRVPHANASLVPVAPGAPLPHWASLSDNIPFGYEMTVPHLAKAPGADVLVMGGCGSVALYAVGFARAAGAGRIDYVDSDHQRLRIAETLGANAIEQEPPKRMGNYAITVDASLDADALRCAIRSTEPEGQCSSVGCHFGDVDIPMMDMYVRGIHLYTGRGQGRPNIEKAMHFLSSGRFDPSPVTTAIIAFDEVPIALTDAPLKAVFVRDAIHGGGPDG